MTDRSVRTRELEDGSTEAFEEGRWVQIAPPGTHRFAGVDSGASLFAAAISQAAPTEARRQAAEAIRRADAVGQRRVALDFAMMMLDKLEAKGGLPEDEPRESRRFLAAHRANAG